MTQKKYINYYILVLIIYIGIITTGFPSQSLGVAWEEMKNSFSQPLEAGGILLFMLSVCGALASFAAGYLIKKVNIGLLAISGLILSTAGLFGYSHAQTWYQLLMCTMPIGLGTGALISASNNYIAQNYSQKYMNWLHGSWGLGSTIAPAVITYTIKHDNSWRIGYVYLVIIQVFVISLFILSLKLWKKIENGEKPTIKDDIEQEDDKNKISKIISGAGIISIIIAFVYSSAEASFGMWTLSMLTKVRNMDQALAGTLIVMYWGSLTVGRLSIAFVSTKLGNRKIITLGMCSALIGLLLMLVNNEYTSIASVIIIGLSFAGVFPALIHETKSRFSKDITPVMIGYEAGSSMLGGAICTPIVGIIIAKTSLTLLVPIVIGFVLTFIILNYILNKIS